MAAAMAIATLTASVFVHRAENDKEKNIRGMVELIGGKIETEPTCAGTIFRKEDSGRIAAVVFEHQDLKGKDIAPLAGLKHLKCLVATGCRLSTDSLVEISRLRHLRELHLPETNVTDGGVDIITRNHDLQILNLSYTNITNRGLRSIANLPKLRILLIMGPSNITENGLLCLGTLPNLEVLYLDDTNIRRDAVESLGKAKPDLTIYPDLATWPNN